MTVSKHASHILISTMIVLSVGLQPAHGAWGKKWVERHIGSSTINASEKFLSNSAVNALQAVVVMMIISGVQTVKKELYEARLKNREPSQVEIAKAAGEVAVKALDEPTFWTGMIAQIATSPIAIQAGNMFNVMLGEKKMRHFFARFLQSAVVSLIASTGWESGRELWIEARRRLKDPADFERAGGSLALLGSVFSIGQSQDESSRVLRKMMGEMGTILFKDSQLRNQYFYNTWRKRIATGDFVADVTAILASVALSRRLMPNMAKVSAVLFGIAGGTVSTYFPKDLRDSITDGVIWMRRFILSRRYDGCKAGLGELVTSSKGEEVITHLFDNLHRCEQYRNDLVSIQLELMYRDYETLRSLLKDRHQAVSAQNNRVITGLDVRIESNRYYVRESIRYIREIYGNFIDMLSELRLHTVEFQQVEVLDCEANSLKRTLGLMNTMLTSLEPRFGNGTFPALETTILQKYYDEGFAERQFLLSMGEHPLECRLSQMHALGL